MPTPSNVHVDAILSQVANKYTNRAFIAPQVAPVVPVVKETGLYWIYGKERFEAIDTTRAPKTEAKTIEWAMSQGNYRVTGHALADFLSDEEIRNADGLDLEAISVELLTEILMVGQERRIASLIADTGNWANTTPGTKWDVASGSDPLADIDAATALLPYVTPNTVIMGLEAWNHFRRNPQVLSALSGNERKTVNVATAADLTGIPNWLIGQSYYNSAKRGQTTTLASIWGKFCWIGYIAPNPSPRELSAMYAFRQGGMVVNREKDTRKHSTWLEVSYAQDEAVTCGDAGYLLTAVIG